MANKNYDLQWQNNPFKQKFHAWNFRVGYKSKLILLIHISLIKMILHTLRKSNGVSKCTIINSLEERAGWEVWDMVFVSSDEVYGRFQIPKVMAPLRTRGKIWEGIQTFGLLVPHSNCTVLYNPTPRPTFLSSYCIMMTGICLLFTLKWA